jgi:hypothetical protein
MALFGRPYGQLVHIPIALVRAAIAAAIGAMGS